MVTVDTHFTESESYSCGYIRHINQSFNLLLMFQGKEGELTSDVNCLLDGTFQLHTLQLNKMITQYADQVPILNLWLLSIIVQKMATHKFFKNKQEKRRVSLIVVL